MSITAALFSVRTQLGLASFPGLPHFYLAFAFTVIIHERERPAKNSEDLGAFIT